MIPAMNLAALSIGSLSHLSESPDSAGEERLRERELDDDSIASGVKQGPGGRGRRTAAKAESECAPTNGERPCVATKEHSTTEVVRW